MTGTRRLLARSLAAGARLAPVDPEPSEELRRALGYLDAGVDAATVVRAGFGYAAALAVAVVLLAAVAGAPIAGLPLALAAAAALAHAIHRAPVALAAVRRTRSLGRAGELIGRAVLRLRLEPSAERAAAFAAGDDRGPLARRLGEHVRRARGTPGSGLASFGEAWRPWFPALDRATTLLRTAAAAPPARRERALDRALGVVVAGTRDRLAAFVGDVRGPVTGIYAFGVLLPLALVGLLPAASVTGAPITARSLVAVYDVLLPAGLLAASGWLLVRRPVAFPPPTVTASHPDVPEGFGRPLLAGLAGATLGGGSATLMLPGWTAPIAAVGFGTGGALVAFALPRRRVHRRVREAESRLPDAVSLVGGRVAEGASVETAVAEAGDRLDGATGEVFAEAARRGAVLGVDVGRAFVGPDGALSDLPSRRARSAAALLAVAAREGRPAGDVVLDLADQLETLSDLESEARRELATITGTLANTAALFGPLVGGATVALAAGMDPAGATGVDPTAAIGSLDGDASAGGPPPSAVDGAPSTADGTDGRSRPIRTPVLGTAVGAYVLLLAALLTLLSTALERGLDPTLSAYRIGIAVPTAAATYLAAFVAAGALL